MKKFVAVPVAALLMAACNEVTTTTPTAVDIPAPNFAAQTFDGGGTTTLASDGWSISSSTGGSTSNTVSIATAPSSETFLGIFTNQIVGFNAPFPSGRVSFDLYIIGSWDGSGKQGNYGPDTWQVGTYCGDGTGIDTSEIENIFWTSFSNQKVNTQNYPRQITDPGSQPAGTGAEAINSLQYKGSGIVVTGPRKDDFGDTVYHLSFAYSMTCAAGLQPMIVFREPQSDLQNVRDEAWGLDNFEITAN